VKTNDAFLATGGVPVTCYSLTTDFDQVYGFSKC